MRRVPSMPARDWERLPADAGRFELAGYTVQLMRFPGRADEALILALSLPRAVWGGATVRPLLLMLGLGALASAAVAMGVGSGIC